jgi:hypothetical protein
LIRYWKRIGSKVCPRYSDHLHLISSSSHSMLKTKTTSSIKKSWIR